MKKCKVISFKKIGKQKTYNVTMQGNQHNYKIIDDRGYGIYTKNSHSAAYSFLAYQTAWLKHYFPIEFMCNLLTSEIDDEEHFEIYRQAALKMGIGFLDYDINFSGLEVEIQEVNGNKMLRMPLSVIKGVGNKASKNIIDNRPYSNMKEFIEKTDGRLVNVKVFATLVKHGCMHPWKEPKQKLIEQYPEAKKKMSKEKKSGIKTDGSLFDEDISNLNV